MKTRLLAKPFQYSIVALALIILCAAHALAQPSHTQPGAGRSNQTLSATLISTPTVTSISPNSAPAGSPRALDGSDALGDNGVKNIWVMNLDGFAEVEGRLHILTRDPRSARLALETVAEDDGRDARCAGDGGGGF